MKLLQLQVRKFRNIVDSGPIDVDPAVTCLVGKNEAGKSALLEALYLFNPAHRDSFDVDDQYPRWLSVQDRRRGPLSDQRPITVTLAIDDDDRKAVSGLLGPGVLKSPIITIDKNYAGRRFWDMQVDESAAVKNLIRTFPKSVADHLKKVNDLQELRARLANARAGSGEEDGPPQEDLSTAIKTLAETELDSKAVFSRVCDVLEPRIPQFFRFTQYNTLPGRIDFEKLAAHSEEGPGTTPLQTARALLELAGTDVSQLTNEDYELRKGELEAVQIDLTQQVFEYWKQNPDLEVNIDVDKQTVTRPNGTTAVARYLDIRLRDKRTGYSNNFNQRSSGFQWFFSFLAAFSEFQAEETPVVLLDEPALTLHGRAQADFLRFINERLAPFSPVIYTTHSPFMVEPDRLDRVRIVEDHGPPTGAVVSADVLAADRDSVFPLQAALGYDIAQNLFCRPQQPRSRGNLGVLYLTIMGTLSGHTLDERWRILPAGGASNVPTFVTLIGPHLDVTVLVDSNAKGMQRIRDMVDRGLLQGHRLVLANSVTASKNADIEDLFTEGDYLKLFNRTYPTSLKIAGLPKGDRIIKRLETLYGSFDHGCVAETFLRHHQDYSWAEKTLRQFGNLIEAINETIET